MNNTHNVGRILKARLARTYSRTFGATWRRVQGNRLIRRASQQLPGWVWLSILSIVVFALFVAIYTGRAHADTAGPNSPGTSVDCAAAGTCGTVVGTVPWGTPGNATASDGSVASLSLASSAVSHYLTATNFGFNIATGSTINGIVVNVVEDATRTTSNATVIEDNSVMIVKGGAVGGTNQATTNAWPDAASGLSTVTYGSSGNLWGQTWAVADINSSNFGVSISAKNVKAGSGATLTANIDYVSITVYFTPPPVAYNQASYRLFGNTDAANTATYLKSWGSASTTTTGRDVVATSDGGYAVTGYTPAFGAGSDDAFIARYDAAGNLLWNTVWGSTGFDDAYRIIQTSDGGFAITGYDNGLVAGDANDAFIAKFSSTGALSWNATWGGTGNDVAEDVAQSIDGGYIITGNTTSYGDTSNGDMFIAKFSSTGALSWSKTWGGSTNVDLGQAVVQTTDGGYAVAGYTSQSGAGGNDAFIVKYDKSGNVSWSKTWGGASNDNAYALVQTTDGGYAIAGNTNSFGTAGDVFLAKFGSTGTLSWSKTWGGSSSDQGNSLIQTSDGGYAIAGITASFMSSANHILLLKFDSSGNVSWDAVAGDTAGSTANYGYGVAQTSDGGYVVTGQTTTFAPGGSGGFSYAAKFNSTGVIANCSANCTSPSGSVTAPSATVTSLSASVSTPTATSSTASATTSSPNATTYTAIAVSPTNIDVGSPLAAQNNAATIPGDGQPFRLRMDIGISTYQLTAGVGAFKLQYAPMTTSCDAAFSNTPTTAYVDVTDTSVVRYYHNPLAVNGLTPKDNHTTTDPSDGTNTLIYETYQEKGTYNYSITNPATIATGQDGLWDFALTTNHTLQGTHYCLRLVKNNGSLLTTYTSGAIAEIITPSSSFAQGSSRVFTAGSSIPTFAHGLSVATTDADQFNGIKQTSDGGYIPAGTYGDVTVTCSPTCIDVTSYDAIIARYNSTGTLQWQKSWGASGDDFANDVIQTSDGGYAVAGTTTSFGAGGDDGFLAKYDSLGTLSWSKTFGGTNTDEAYSLVQTSDGGYAVTGYVRSAGAGLEDVFLSKFDSSGGLTWTKTWGGTNTDIGYTVIQTSDGGYAIGCSTSTYGYVLNNNAFCLLKFDSSGNLTWSKIWGGGSNDNLHSMASTSDGGYVVIGTTGSFGAGGSGDFAIIKYDSSGNVSWNKTWGGTDYDDARDVVQTSDGGYVVTGSTQGFSATNGTDVALVRFDSSGNLTWNRTWGTTSTDIANSIVRTSDGGLAVGGSASGYAALLAKFDGGGNINNCGSGCDAPVATVTTPNAITSSPSVTLGSTTLTVSSPSAGLALTLTDSTLVTLGYSGSVGSAQVAQNKPFDATRVTSEFRLRTNINITNSGVSLSGQSFKLQYSVRGSDLSCDASFTGESYADVTTTTPIYYYNDPSNASGDGLSWSANDPYDSGYAPSPQAYQESNNFTNSMLNLYSSSSGEWEFSLAIKSGTLPGNDYCLRVVKSDGSLLGSYNQVVDVAYGPSMLNLLRQEAWWNRSGVRQNFFIKGQ